MLRIHSVVLRLSCVVVAPGLLALQAPAQVACQPSWQASFGQALGVEGEVDALEVYDDGTGRALYVAGDFDTVGGVSAASIAKWDGTHWSAVGSGISGAVRALTVFDDGSGEALFAGGEFQSAGGGAANFIAKWDGSAWTALGSGMSGGPGATRVSALVAYDDGTGGVLCAGGQFDTAGGEAASNVATWDGASWSPLASGVSGEVLALAIVDHGNGPVLYVGGDFVFAGAVLTGSIAKWNGTKWSVLGSGIGKPVRALAAFDDGSGEALFAGGDFTSPGTYLAKWNGSAWSEVGWGTDGRVRALASIHDGDGPGLYVGGDFSIAASLGGIATSDHIAKWNGTQWLTLGDGVDGSVRAVVKFDDGSHPAPFVGGDFTAAGSVLANHITTWACSAWTDLGFALAGTMGTPLLVGIGDLTAGSPASVVLQKAAPVSVTHLLVADHSTPTAFKCGTLVPGLTQFHKHIVLVTSASGDLHLEWPAFPASLSGLSLYFQYVIPDAGAVCGAALSNALRADVP